MRNHCDSCKYWDPTGERHGKCRIGPPVFYTSGPGVKPFGVWPITDKYDWCGEHKPEYAQADVEPNLQMGVADALDRRREGD